MINICIFSPHEDKDNYSNRNLIYSKWSRKDKIYSTIYVGSFNYKTHNQKKLTNFFYEKDNYKGVQIYRIYMSSFQNNSLSRFFSYIIFSILSLFVFYLIDKKKYYYVIGESVPPLCSFFAYLCSLKNSSKFIYQIRDPWPLSLYYSGLMSKNSFIYIFFERINKFLIKNSKFLITVLPYMENHYRKHYNYKKKIYYLCNPGEVDSFKSLPYPKIRKKIKIGFAGGFNPTAQMINYFKAIHFIQKKKDLSFSYYFLGKGNDLEKCKHFVKFNNLKKVYFLKSRTKKEVLKFISKCHLTIVLLPNNKNTKFGYNLNKLIDYTICGRPVIFTNDLKKNCFIEDYKMGFNTKPLPNKIAEKIIKFKKLSYKKKKRLANNARKYALQKLDIRRLHKIYSEIFYKNLII